MPLGCGVMQSDITAVGFRKRALECRQIAAEVQEPDWRASLLELAQDLETEADAMDAAVASRSRAETV